MKPTLRDWDWVKHRMKTTTTNPSQRLRKGFQIPTHPSSLKTAVQQRRQRLFSLIFAVVDTVSYRRVTRVEHGL